MIKKKTTLQLIEIDNNMTWTDNNLRRELLHKKEWVSVESLTKYLNSELNDLHKKLLDKELPELCQANYSGAIIWLESLKNKLKVVESE